MTHKRNSNSKMKANNVPNTNISSSKLAQFKEVREQKTSSLSSELEGKINSITQGYRPYIRKKLIDMATTTNLENANIICNYIVTEQNEINIKESTREGKIKILLSLDNYFHSTKSFTHMTKHDILNYLNSLKKPKLLGYIFDILVKTLQIEPSIKLNDLPRMADFALMG